MVDATQTGCINHPSSLAVNRCKQCIKPTCSKCTVTGPTGKFCSEDCMHAHEEFIRRSQSMVTTARSTYFVKVRAGISRLIVLLVVLCAAGVVGSVFDVPVLSELILRIRYTLGF